MPQLISMFATQARTALQLYPCYDHEVDSRASTGQDRSEWPFSPILATSCYPSHVEHCGLAKDISFCLTVRSDSSVGFRDEVPLSDLIELYLTTKGALPLAKL
jgi:hypothetical protein